jgi:hypothetical protein
MVLSVGIASTTWERVKTTPKQTRRTLKVTGSATQRIVSDLIEWSGDLETFHADRTQAYKLLRQHSEVARDYLVELGVPESDVRLSSVTTREIIDTETLGTGPDRIQRHIRRGWSTHQTITVSSTELEVVEKASREVTSLLERGVTIASRPPTYHYTKLGEVKVDMLGRASANARERADRIVQAAGGTGVKKLWDADMGVINVNPANSTATSWQGNNDKTSLEKDIITIVHLTFELP